MHQYKTFGLSIGSEMELPELMPGPSGQPDLSIRLIRDRCPLAEQFNSSQFLYRPSQDEIYFYWEHVGTFFVERGCQITIYPHRDADERLVRLPLLGIVLSAVLLKRELLGLHASAVSVNGQAALFIGRKGMGKSTLAAALYARGHPLIGDDMVAVKLGRDQQSHAYPGFPQLKLSPAAAPFLFKENQHQFYELAAGVEKLGYLAIDNFPVRSTPLSCIYVLTDGPSITLKELSPAESLLQLLQQSYATRVFGRFLLRAEEITNLTHCSELTRKVSVYQLTRPRELVKLPLVARAVEEHVNGTLTVMNKAD